MDVWYCARDRSGPGRIENKGPGERARVVMSAHPPPHLRLWLREVTLHSAGSPAAPAATCEAPTSVVSPVSTSHMQVRTRGHENKSLKRRGPRGAGPARIGGREWGGPRQGRRGRARGLGARVVCCLLFWLSPRTRLLTIVVKQNKVIEQPPLQDNKKLSR
eukprot:scaffold558_cov120-Isochrysis_galbana.AAC.3